MNASYVLIAGFPVGGWALIVTEEVVVDTTSTLLGALVRKIRTLL